MCASVTALWALFSKNFLLTFSFISTKIWNSIQQNITIDDLKLFESGSKLPSFSELKKLAFRQLSELPFSALLPAGNVTIVVRPSWFVSVALE